MELGGLFKEFTDVFSSLKNSISDIYSKIKLLSTSIVEINVKIDKTIELDNKEFSNVKDNISINNKQLSKDINDIKKDFNLSFSSKDEEIKLLKAELRELKQIIIKNNNDFISYKSDVDSSIKSIEKLLSNNLDEKLKTLVVKHSELYNDFSSIKEKIKSLEDSFIHTIKIEKSNSQELSNYKNQIAEDITSIKEIISKTTIRKKDLLKSLQEDGNIDLLYNLKLTPRVLPKTVVNGLLIIDAKDGKLKYGYNDKWKIV